MIPARFEEKDIPIVKAQLTEMRSASKENFDKQYEATDLEDYRQVIDYLNNAGGLLPARVHILCVQSVALIGQQMAERCLEIEINRLEGN